MRLIRRLAFILAGFVVLALLLDAFIGVFQPVVASEESEGVLRTVDENDEVHENRLAVIDDHGTLWLQSGHHFRGWYHRLVRNPEVELIYHGEVRPYLAVPLDTPEVEERVRDLLKQRAGAFRFYLIRTLLLYADIKPVRLDPRQPRPAA
jgi:hypothetical protein